LSWELVEKIHNESWGIGFMILVWVISFPIFVYRAQVTNGPAKRKAQIMNENIDEDLETGSINVLTERLTAKPPAIALTAIFCTAGCGTVHFVRVTQNWPSCPKAVERLHVSLETDEL
jgi:hypothetical protein